MKVKELFFLLFTLVLCSCGSSKRSTALSDAVPQRVVNAAREALSEGDRQRLEYYYLEASKQKMLGNHAAAYELYRYCLDICPDAPEVLFDLALYHLGMREDSLALQRLQRATELDPRNTYYREILASYYLDHNKTKEALAQLEEMAALTPKRSDVLGQLTRLFIAHDRLAEAIHTLNRIELLEGKMANVSYQKFALYKELGQEKKAFAELESLCKEYPHEMSYRLAIGNQ